MVTLDLAEASWFPLLMVFVLAGVMFLLYLSMRREIRKIRIPRPGRGSPDDPGQR